MLTVSAACERNKEPILGVLRVRFAGCSRVLEIGSGTGQHAVHFARALPHLTWQPTERLANLQDLADRVRLEGPPNLLAPLEFDVREAAWPPCGVDALFTANTLHIMSWSDVQCLLRGAGTVLAPGGVACIYGPFLYDGRHTSDSNRDFDRMLRHRDPNSGLRDATAVADFARLHGLRLEQDHDLPANNRLLAFSRRPSADQ